MTVSYQQLKRAALAAFLCLSLCQSKAQMSGTHHQYKDRAVSFTVPDSLAETKDADGVTFYDGANSYIFSRDDSPDISTGLLKLKTAFIKGGWNIIGAVDTVLTAQEAGPVGAGTHYVMVKGYVSYGIVYFFATAGTMEHIPEAMSTSAFLQNGLVWISPDKPTGPSWGSGVGIGGCPGCANALTNSMSNLTKQTVNPH